MRRVLLLITPLCVSACCFVFCPSPPAPPQPTKGELGHMTFGYDSGVGRTLDTPVAVGARVGLEIQADGHQFASFSVLPADPSIAEILPPVSNGSDQHGFMVHALAPGTTELDAFTDQVDDRVRIVVEAPDAIEFVNGWGAADGPTVLAGRATRYWVRLLHDGHRLAGNEATRFTYTGPLAPASEHEVPVDTVPDAEENLAVGTGPGAATITATSNGVATSLPVTIVDASTIDEGVVLRVSSPDHMGCAIVELMAFSGATPVFGATCNQGYPFYTGPFDCFAPADAPSFPDNGGWTGNTPAFCVRLCPDRPGHATCTLDPSTFSVDVPIGP
jgi:hypothetical protein